MLNKRKVKKRKKKSLKTNKMSCKIVFNIGMLRLLHPNLNKKRKSWFSFPQYPLFSPLFLTPKSNTMFPFVFLDSCALAPFINSHINSLYVLLFPTLNTHHKLSDHGC